MEQKEKSKGNEGNAAWAKEYGAKVGKELSDIFNEILKLLGAKSNDSPHIPKASNAESKVLYHKMAGNYHRYIAEFTVDAKKEIAAKATKGAVRR